MASQETGDDSNGDSVDSVTTDMTVPFIFERIFDEYIKPFKERLANIKENKFGDVWSGEREKHDKTMRHARNFISNVVDAFRTQYDSVNKEVDGSACDKFQQYIHKKLNQLKDKYGMLMNSLDEIKKDFDRRISVIKENFEKRETNVTTSKSDIYEAISNTELMDPVHINHALLCCRVAYECKDLEKPERYLNKFADKHWLSELVVSHENAAVPRYVMARSGNVLYVAFRGLGSAVCTTVQGSVRPKVTWMGQTNSSE